MLRMFFAAAKEEEEHGDAAVLSPAIRVAQALRKQLGVSSLYRELFDEVHRSLCNHVMKNVIMLHTF